MGARNPGHPMSKATAKAIGIAVISGLIVYALTRQLDRPAPQQPGMWA